MTDPTFVIAEAGVNHNGRLDLALGLVDAAAAAGADAVKFQTFRASELATGTAPKADYQRRTTGAESQLEMLARLELGEAEHIALQDRCAARGIEFMSSAFDLGSLELLLRLGVRRLKLGSGELTNGPLLLAAARSGRPVIVSSGMATLDEIETSLGVLAFGLLHPDGSPDVARVSGLLSTAEGHAALAASVSLLHCTTEYPAPLNEVNLRVIPALAQRFGITTGYSDHTVGILVSLAAVAAGARIVEKHVTLDRSLPGPDHAASIEPDQLAALVSGIRDIERALGSADKAPSPAESHNAPVARKSLVATRPITAGEPFTGDNLGAKRPGTGRSPMDYWRLLGTPAPRGYDRDELIDR